MPKDFPTRLTSSGGGFAYRFRPRHGTDHDFRAQKMISSGVVEGLNNKAKVTLRKSYGFRTYRVLELSLYHSLGKLPEPECTHDFF